MNNQHTELLRRHKLNPILTAADWPYPVNRVFNPGATLLPDGTTLLLCRVEDRRGLALFDPHTPEKCLKRGDEWFLGPEEPYERQGDVDNVVFPCGYTIAADGDTLHIYYGAADSCIALATGSVGTMLEWLERGPNR